VNTPSRPGTGAPPTRQLGIVDDDQAVRESLCFLLDVSGYPAAAFESAQDFLVRYTRGSLAGLILDHHMPHITGLELVARLRADGDTMPILLITGAPSPAVMARARVLGIEQVIEKPPSEHELLRFAAAALS
jgi:two-component system, LuxR family, response regulator FixJ